MKPLLFIFLAALLMRAALLGYMLHIKPAQEMWSLNEEGMIARSLVLEHRFASPFHDANGPTAWVAPGYPAMTAVVFRFFGVQTAASAEVVVALNALFSALTAILIFRMGEKTFGTTVGWVAGGAWALSPYVALLGWLIWETSLSAMLMTYAFWRTLLLERSSRVRDWIYAGACWGVAVLVNPALAAPFPLLLVYLVCLSKNKLRLALTTAGMFVAVLLPWTLRNEFVFHKVMFVRSNAWAEIYFGNAGFELHPRGESGEYQRLGEAAYCTKMKRRLIDYVREHPRAFVTDALERIWPFWTAPAYLTAANVIFTLLAITGLAFGSLDPGRRIAPFLIMLVFYPVTYYFSHTFARFRHPIEPLMFVLAAYAGVTLVSILTRKSAAVVHPDRGVEPGQVS